MGRLRLSFIAPCSLGLLLGSSLTACVDDGGTTGDPTGSASGSSDETAADEGSTFADETAAASTTALPGTSDATDATDTAGIPAGVLARASFVVPAGTVVEEFHFEAPLLAEPGLLADGTLVVAVRDLTHPERDAATLCPNSHPLDGCATVDYGAFGMTHDNRIGFEGPDGPWAVHLYKDRSLRPQAEPLALNE